MKKHLNFLLVAGFTLTLSPWTAKAQSAVLDMNDVSVLFPLPEPAHWNTLPQAGTEAAHGTLLPRAFVERLPTLLQGVKNSILYSDIHAMGFRIDPCFTEGHAPAKCQTQIRMVWQPLIKLGDKTSTIDVTLHTFYQLSETEFSQLVQKFRALKANQTQISEQSPLTVHPVLQREGPQGEYRKKLLEILYEFTGRERLSRITFMPLFGRETVWFFGGVDIRDGEFTSIRIPRLKEGENTLQQFANVILPDPTSFKGGIFPAPQDEENLNLLLTDSTKLKPENEEDIIRSVRAAFRFENPKLHNPGTVDCVSCHTAQPVKAWAIRQYPALNLEQSLSQNIYHNAENNLQNPSPLQDRTNIVRIFGYFTDKPFVAQRVINESSEVVNYIKQNY